MSVSPLQPDPSVIGGVPKAPFVLKPNLARLFNDRASRFEALAQGSHLAPYLDFLAGITRIQSELVSALPPPEPVPADRVERARANAMPPIDRAAMGGSPDCREVLQQFFEKAEALEKPAAAAEALAQVRTADEEMLTWMIGNVMADDLPVESLAHHLYVAAAMQIQAARLAAGLDGSRLVPIRVGVCPACGGRPVASMVLGFHGAEGARYASCSCCATMWNEVRVKCLACGSTKGIGYRAVETRDEEATVKAEVCDPCNSWMKILYQNKNPSLDVVADDVASLGLDLLMKDTEYKRAGFDPFLMGY
ncbi:formate dehydrogenase accessory protein FdhE [Sinorhizobium meliloti]|uniref:formate dehydrogenase accessory protein FdhE n=1 Tax=Rhizobium meliloti TaxID=382 RepID=UPI000FD89E63|nr:formate dehydrogenase accessory protein FdhE [Sinorhizobium meliloti]MDE3761751.1 formate dehydrogenase accessory protein FdhE [Sinorhizobium meliloti]MDW9902800.1 formate dehydrogenase accessory protein FdhE [Sinorhizobium meliloti]MDW9909528.1 formate dehydrogenase accessory protein FdhE [Sinorhizobium meliloti]MDW9959378.1 formate dehydrogenase accessory protein FdhE [Sinorhizobium meliloti]MDW9970666.1 formate dehydrogenase accessory protein FdhE [Sinorhizobium meliloti]